MPDAQYARAKMFEARAKARSMMAMALPPGEERQKVLMVAADLWDGAANEWKKVADALAPPDELWSERWNLESLRCGESEKVPVPPMRGEFDNSPCSPVELKFAVGTYRCDRSDNFGCEHLNKDGHCAASPLGKMLCADQIENECQECWFVRMYPECDPADHPCECGRRAVVSMDGVEMMPVEEHKES